MNIDDKIEMLHEVAFALSLVNHNAAAALRRYATELNSKPIPGFPGYRATRQGTILGKSGFPMSEWWAGNKNSSRSATKVGPYRADGTRGRIWVHRLVCLAFHGQPEHPDMEVHHIDFDHTNNRPENLEWLTHEEHVRKHAHRYDNVVAGAF